MPEPNKTDPSSSKSEEQQPEATTPKAPEPTYVLRVLSGPHSGAEITLSEHPMLLGKGDSCDILLVDAALQDQQARFFCKDGTVFCTPVEGAKVEVNGEAITAEQALQPFQPIICGSTLLSVGPNTVVWPSIEPTGPQETPSEQAPQEDPGKPAINDLAVAVESRKLSWRLILWILIGISGMLGVYGWWVYRKNTRSPNVERTVFPIVALRESIEHVLEQHQVPPEGIKIAVSGHRFVLTCYVKTQQQRIDLEQALHRLPYVNFQSMHIFAQERLLAKAQDILDPYQTLAAAPGNRLDSLSIKGFLYTMEQLPAIKKQLLTEIPGLNAVETALSNADELYNLASNLLSQYALKGLLKVQVIRTGIMITGAIQAGDEPRWKEAQKTLKKTFDGICKVLSYVATVAPDAVKKIFFPSPITTVSIPKNKAPWVDLKNGDRYFEGSLLPSGYKIQSITKKGIRLQKNDEVTLFALSEL